MINGKILKNAIISGANNIANRRASVDELNVFPVPDGDTGTNMSMTVGACIGELEALGDDCTVAEAAKTAEIAAEAAAKTAGIGVEVGVHTGKAVGIVAGALVRIGQHLIGLAYLLELLLGSLVAGVPVRVVFHGQLSVCFLYVISAGALVYAQYLIVITFVFCHNTFTSDKSIDN